VDIVGWDESKLDQAASWRQTYEPVIVLRNSHPPPQQEDAAESNHHSEL
jgi:hypothetical protein